MFELIVKLQPPLPEQDPPQLLNDEPAVGAALSDTAVPEARLTLHVPFVLPPLIAQLIPAPVTVPVPVPLPVTDSV